MPEVRLPEHASLSTVSEWPSEEDARFLLSRGSSFGFLTEPVAISYVYRLSREGRSPSVRVHYELPDLASLDDSAVGRTGVVGTLFGQALLHAADSVEDREGHDIHEELQAALWNFIQDRRGTIGAGNYLAIVSRDPGAELPALLRDPAQAGDRRTFPSREGFSSVLRAIAKEMGIASELGVGPTENALLTFLYETARNAHEHGRTPEGVRGITVEKFRALSREELESRAVFPPEMSDYLTRVWTPVTARGALVAITVLDTGPGIHATLPPKEGEDDWARLERALRPGESRKPKGLSGRGEGFSNVINALQSCETLRSFLAVRSGPLLGFRDFTEPNPEFTAPNTETEPENLYRLTRWPQDLAGAIGSSLTLLWPITEQPDQSSLPFDEAL